MPVFIGDFCSDRRKTTNRINLLNLLLFTSEARKRAMKRNNGADEKTE